MLIVGLAVIAAAGVLAQERPDVFPALSPPFILGTAAVAVLSSVTALVLGVVRGHGDVAVYPLLQNIALPLLRLAGVIGVLMAGLGVTSVLIAWMAPLPLVLLIASAVAWRMVERGTALKSGPSRGGVTRVLVVQHDPRSRGGCRDPAGVG